MKYFSKLGMTLVVMYIFMIFALQIISPASECVPIPGYSSCLSSGVSVGSINGGSIREGRSISTSILIPLLKPWVPLNYIFREGIGLKVIFINAIILYILGLLTEYFIGKIRSRKVVSI